MAICLDLYYVFTTELMVASFGLNEQEAHRAIWLQPARRGASLRNDDPLPSYNGRAMGILRGHLVGLIHSIR